VLRQVSMPTVALFDRGQRATSLPAHVHVTPPSPSKMQPTTTISQQASTISSSLFHPSHHPVQFLHGNTALQKFTPSHCCCHPSQHSLPSSNESTTVDPDTGRLCMLETTAKTVLALLQQAPTSHATNPLVQNLHMGDTALLDFKTPCCRFTIRHWLPSSIHDSCFYSIGGSFLSFPGSNALLNVSMLQPAMLQPVQPFCLAPATPRPTTHQHVTLTITAASLSKTRRLDLLKEVKALHEKILEAIAELQQLRQELVVSSPLLLSIPTNVGLAIVLDKMYVISKSNLIPLVTGMTHEITQFDPVISITNFKLKRHCQQLSLIVTILQFQHIFQTTPISIRPPPEPPPAVICPTKYKMKIDSLAAIPSFTILVSCPLAFPTWFSK
jgi:hypothetical protein